MVNEVPVANAVPPVATSYQLIVPALEVAPKTKVPGVQRKPGVVEVMVGVRFTEAVTAVLEDEQPDNVAST